MLRMMINNTRKNTPCVKVTGVCINRKKRILEGLLYNFATVRASWNEFNTVVTLPEKMGATRERINAKPGKARNNPIM